MKAIFLKLIILLVSLQVFGQAVSKKNNFLLNGSITNWNGKYIFFSHQGIGVDRIWDSTIVLNNKFVFKGQLKESGNGFITTLLKGRVNNLNDSNITKRLFIDASVMEIKLTPNNFQSAKLIGSKSQNEYSYLEKIKVPIHKMVAPFNRVYDSLNSEYIKRVKSGEPEDQLVSLYNTLDSLRDKIDLILNKIVLIDRNFFKKNPNSYITAYLLASYNFDFPLKDLNIYYNNMSSKSQNSEYGKKLKNTILSLTKGSPGSIALDFTAKDINGDTLTLSSYKGKYILLDFWASWCRPCRAGNPELIKLYEKYKSKGIEFIGLADDVGKEEKWKQAVLKDGISIWKQIIDKEIGKQYSIHTIPTQILINQQGIIINRFGDLGEPNENLSKVLNKLFNH